MEMSVKKAHLEVVEHDGKRFYKLVLGSKAHGRPSFFVWVPGKAVKFDDKNEPYLEFPVKGAVVKTEKGALVLKQDGYEDYVVHHIYVSTGYRGEANFKVYSDNYRTEVYDYEVWKSPQGALGVSRGGLIVARKDDVVYVAWKRTGRLYGKAAKGVTKITPDGKEHTVEGVTWEQYLELLNGQETGDAPT